MRATESESERTMLYLAAAVSTFLFAYLFVALLRPEWF
jgi:K+-transporting ATPase KdpF subunit